MPRKKIEVEMEEIRVRVPKVQVRKLEELVKRGDFVDTSETVRAAIREFLRRADER
ncbi:MAG: ribbon-helix-helix protein, CopG family [Methermicoccaceae archaeon]